MDGERPSAGWKVRLYRAALRRHAQLQRITNAALAGFFLGLFDAEDRARVDEDYYDSAWELVDGTPRRYGDDAMVESGLFEWERSAVEAHFAPGSSLVVLGAGAGREVLALLEAGFDARGYDPHSGLVARGERLLAERGHPGRVALSERDTMPSHGGPVDAVVLGWGMYTLIAGRERRIALLRDVAAALRPGSPVLLSFFPRVGRARHLRLAHAVATALRVLRGADAPELGDWLMPNFVHYFSRSEVEAELQAAGFELAAWSVDPYGHAVAKVR